jgi:hypothetical protein
VPEPLTIYECPVCGAMTGSDHDCLGKPDHRHPRCRRAEVRVFREEDVRPLWDFVRAETEVLPSTGAMPQDVLDAFPAPENWR